ncbi:MAG: thioredoxin family protein [Apibacter sp.]|nr:thioredoxin family protein [Apibacter sp.]
MVNSIKLENYWDKGVSYAEYKDIIEIQAKEGILSENADIKKLAEYTRLNLSRINRNDKSIVLEESIISSLKKISHRIHILVISEGWCGDAAQIVPVINKISEVSEKLEMRIFFRDQDELLINHYLTNGGKAIPIVIFIDAETSKEITHWGPRPKPCAPFLKKYKTDPENYTHDDFAKDIQGFYNRDKGRTISQELVEMILR